MDPWTTDLLFTAGHHVLVFAIAGVLAFELGAVRRGLNGAEAARIARVDMWYGIDASFRPPEAEVLSVRQWLWAQVLVFALIPILAAAMARGAGFIAVQ